MAYSIFNDLFLVILVAAVVVAAVVINTKVLLYYQQKSDSSFASSILVKVIIITSLTLAWIVNLLLPIDVRNSRPVPGILDMQFLWKFAFMTLALFLGLIVPGAMFYSEVEGDDLEKKKMRKVICNLIFMLFIAGGLVACTYPFWSGADLPVTQYECGGGAWMNGSDDTQVSELGNLTCGNGQESTLHITVSFDIYLIACLCFLGWFFFVLFGGIGLSAVPLDLILGFVNRPRAIDEHTYQMRRKLIGAASKKMLSRSEDLVAADGDLSTQSGMRIGYRRRQVKAEYNKFKRDVMLLEEQHEKVKIGKFQRGENLAVAISKLVVGIICAILSVTWVLHILLYICAEKWMPNKQPITPFLNGMFSGFEGALYPLGVAFFALFTLYLLLCVIMGCLKFGMRVFLFFSIHPMRYQNTPLNSILFNVWMVLLCATPVVQFSQQAFSDYARLTDAEVIFGSQIKYMTFYRWFFETNAFIYALLISFLLALIWLFVRPRDDVEVSFDRKTDLSLHRLAGIAISKKKGKKDKKDEGKDSASDPRLPMI